MVVRRVGEDVPGERDATMCVVAHGESAFDRIALEHTTKVDMTCVYGDFSRKIIAVMELGDKRKHVEG